MPTAAESPADGWFGCSESTRKSAVFLRTQFTVAIERPYKQPKNFATTSKLIPKSYPPKNAVKFHRPETRAVSSACDCIARKMFEANTNINIGTGLPSGSMGAVGDEPDPFQSTPTVTKKPTEWPARPGERALPAPTGRNSWLQASSLSNFIEVVLRFAGLQYVHRLEAYATFHARQTRIAIATGRCCDHNPTRKREIDPSLTRRVMIIGVLPHTIEISMQLSEIK